MLERRAYDEFLRWSRSQNQARESGGQPTALLVTGARQVGKTYLINRFLDAEYTATVRFDLIAQPQLARALSADLTADEIMARLTAAASGPLPPSTPTSRTAIFIDEVQAAPALVTQLKYLIQQYDFDFILSGSLLGVAVGNIASYPVGSVHQVQMYPLDMKEFAAALGVSAELFAQAETAAREGTQVLDILHDRLMRLFHEYLVVGGMPAAVDMYQKTHDVQAVRELQRQIVQQYRADITQYADVRYRLFIGRILDLIPSQLTRTSHRFQFSDLEGVQRFTTVVGEFTWLIEAGVAHRVPAVAAPHKPLILQGSESKFKLFSNDVGLLTSQFSREVDVAILAGDTAGLNLGGVYENFVACELIAHGNTPYYFSNRKVGELDLLTETPDGVLTAFEVKSGRDYLTHKALNNALAVDNYTIDRAVVLAETNVSTADVHYIPIYLAGVG